MAVLKRINTEDKNLNQVQENVDKVLDGINSNPLLGGRIRENISLSTGVAHQLEHGLNRKPIGYFIIKKNAEADVWDTVSSMPAKTIILTSSANVVISIYIF